MASVTGKSAKWIEEALKNKPNVSDLPLKGEIDYSKSLDFYKNYGVYKVTFSAKIPGNWKELNYPVRVRGLLFVYNWGGVDQATQLYYNTYSGNIYTRELNGGKWSEWGLVNQKGLSESGGMFLCHGEIDYSKNLNTYVNDGYYRVTFSAKIPGNWKELNYPIRSRGVLVIYNWGNSSQSFQIYYETYKGGVYTRELNGGKWSEWREGGGSGLNSSGGYFSYGEIDYSKNLNTYVNDGYYRVTFSAKIPGNWKELNYPVRVRGLLFVYRWGNESQCSQVYFNTYSGDIYTRELNGGTWTEWRPVGGFSGGDSKENYFNYPKIFKRQHSSKLRKGGVIGTNGVVPLGLTFDHGFKNFKDVVLPLLQKHGLSASIAINPGQMDISENGGLKYSEIESFCINNGIEVSHHTMSHGNVSNARTNYKGLEEQITKPFEILEKEMPKLICDSFIMPGTGGNYYDGFNNGRKDSLWWEHPAGKILIENFPVMSVKNKGWAVPNVGDFQTTMFIDRKSFDTNEGADYVKTLIDYSIKSQLGICIFLHPSQISLQDRVTVAKVKEVIDYIAKKRDEGLLYPLTLSGFAYSDISSNYVMDLFKCTDKVSGSVDKLVMTPMIDWAYGGEFIYQFKTTSQKTTVYIKSKDKSLDITRNISPKKVGDLARIPFVIPKGAGEITFNAVGSDKKIVPA